MSGANKIFKNAKKIRDFLDPVIYPKQFNNDEYKIIYHIVNICYPLIGLDSIPPVIKHYIPNYNQGLLDMALENYGMPGKTLFRYNCFSHIEGVLSDQDMSFTGSGKKRHVKIKEYKFLLHRITRNLYNSALCKSIMVNKMFWKMKAEYYQYTVRHLGGHKLAFILMVLHKHKYLHITYNSKNQRVVQIGPANPYYQLKKVPDIAESQLQNVVSKTDREIIELKSIVKMLEQVRDEYLATNISLHEEKDKALEELENVKSSCKDLIEIHEKCMSENNKLRTQIQIEKDKHIGTFHDYKPDLIPSSYSPLN